MRKTNHTVASIVITAMILAAGCGKGSGEVSLLWGNSRTLTAISLSPNDPSIAKDSEIQFSATGIYSDNSTEDITAAVAWDSADPSIATVGPLTLSASLSVYQNRERVKGRRVGKTQIRAALGSVTGQTTLTVTPATLVSLAIDPVNPSIAKGTSRQFTATGTFSDNTTQDMTVSVTWASATESVASVSNTAGSIGLAQALAIGNTVISASSGSITGTTNLVVTPATLASIEVTPTNRQIAKGTGQQYLATGTYSDQTTQDLTQTVSWQTSDPSIATVGNAPGVMGYAIAVSAGTATISASAGGMTGSTSLTVSSAQLVSLAMAPLAPSVAKGTGQQFTATGTFSDGSIQDLTSLATWSTSDSSVVSISNAAGSRGYASSKATGSAAITAIFGALSATTVMTVTPAALVSLSVSPLNRSIAKGTSQQYTATGIYSDSTTQDLTASVTWSSSNTSIASISNAAGSKGLAASIATGATTITAASGSISGTTTLTVTAATLSSLAVSPSTATIPTGTTRQFTATGTYSDSTIQNLTSAVTWSSSNTGVATISNAAGSKGLATGVGSGTATMTAVTGGITGSAVLTITSSGSVTLRWQAPTANTDGSQLTDLAGYRIYYGNSAGSYTRTIDVGNVTTYTVSNLAPGTYYFAITSYNVPGNESNYSNEINKAM